MLVLFETPAGFALFKVLDEGKLSNVEVIIFINWILFCSLGFIYLKPDLCVYCFFVLICVCRIWVKSSRLQSLPER